MAVGFDPPWRLDPLKNIVGVGWGGALLVISFKYTASKRASSVPWTATFMGGTDDRDLRTEKLTDEIGPRVNPPGPPRTAPPNESIPGNNNWWHYPRVETVVSDSRTITTEVIDLAHFVGYISGGFPFFGGDFATAEAAYASFAIAFASLFGRPPDPLNSNDLFVGLSFIITSHTETSVRTTTTKQGRTITFVNMGRIASREPTVKLARVLKFVLQMDATTSSEFAQWELTFGIYIGGLARKFTINNSLPTGVEPDPTKPVASIRTMTGFNIEQAVPATQVTILIDLQTYAISMTRVNV